VVALEGLGVRRAVSLLKGSQKLRAEAVESTGLASSPFLGSSVAMGKLLHFCESPLARDPHNTRV
jgi:hypothetical protein